MVLGSNQAGKMVLTGALRCPLRDLLLLHLQGLQGTALGRATGAEIQFTPQSQYQQKLPVILRLSKAGMSKASMIVPRSHSSELLSKVFRAGHHPGLLSLLL